MFSGDFSVTLDDMGRISLPRRLREMLNTNNVILTKHVDGCLWLFTIDGWKKFEKDIFGNTSQFSAQDLALRRRFSPTELDIDKQGRILVAQTLRDHAKLSKDCIILGQHDYFEIWAEDRYKAYLEATEELFRAASEKLDAKIKREKELSGNGDSSHAGSIGTDYAVSVPEGES